MRCEESHPGQACEHYLDGNGKKRCRIRVRADNEKAHKKRTIRKLKVNDQYGLGRGWSEYEGR